MRNEEQKRSQRRIINLGTFGAVISACMLVVGCMGSNPVSTATPAGGGYRASSATAGESAPAAKQSAPSGAPAPMSMDREESASSARSQSVAPAPSERPGLGTAWGERRQSQVRHVSFERASIHTPTSELAVFYNDRSGARAMTRYSDYRSMTSSVFNVKKLDVSVSLRDANGKPMSALFANGRLYAVGEAGQRYTINIKNRTGLRLEVVAAVDGLDVLDGKAANPSKRGYLVPPHGTLEIAGWRTSADHVAAFRLSSVRNAYAARKGTDRNVGVVGVAFFHERGTQPRHPWTDEEVRRRHSANPFPNRYAAPPPVYR
jgi:hypothetical protein